MHGDVGDLVADDRRQLVLVGGKVQQTGAHENPLAYRDRVHRNVRIRRRRDVVVADGISRNGDRSAPPSRAGM